VITPDTVTVDVSAVAPPGAAQVVADVFLPDAPLDPPIVMTCLPGGGMSRRYFDIEVDGDPGTYSMARWLAGLGVAVITIDPPGVGESDVPDDPWTLTPTVVASVCAAASGQLVDTLRPDRPGLVSVGVGHSAGALLTVYVQAAWRSYDALALLGFAGGGLPRVLTDAELELSGDAERARREVVALAKTRFGRPLPRGTTGPSDMLLGVAVPDAAREGITRTGGALLAVVGLTSMIPGASAPELAAVDVPLFLGVGDRDITGDAHRIPAQFPSARDVTLYVLEESGHNHNVAPSRRRLWDRLGVWARSLRSP